MNDERLQRYSRHILLPEIDITGQQRLQAARVLIVGLGGLGGPVALYLAASGVGELVVNDDDHVELSNLQRQILFTTDDLGHPKAAAAAAHLARLNPETRVTPLPNRLDAPALYRQVAAADLVIDCSDNFPTRFRINRACVANATPLISGAVIRWQGLLFTFSATPEAPCYACIFDEQTPAEEEESCAAAGVVAPLAGVVGSFQATEAIKFLVGYRPNDKPQLLSIHGATLNCRAIAIQADPACPVCGNRRSRTPSAACAT